jgi:hypothetical protein
MMHLERIPNVDIISLDDIDTMFEWRVNDYLLKDEPLPLLVKGAEGIER